MQANRNYYISFRVFIDAATVATNFGGIDIVAVNVDSNNV